jgi:hypothetical protein
LKKNKKGARSRTVGNQKKSVLPRSFLFLRKAKDAKNAECAFFSFFDCARGHWSKGGDWSLARARELGVRHFIYSSQGRNAELNKAKCKRCSLDKNPNAL